MELIDQLKVPAAVFRWRRERISKFSLPGIEHQSSSS